jgi:hypothetical protein
MAADPAATQALGPFRVTVDPARAAAYADEIGGAPPADGYAPLCYPAVWFSLPEIRAAIHAACEATNSVPVHESQGFAFVAPLRLGDRFDLTVRLRRDEAPPRLVIDALVSTPEGLPRARIDALLRLVPRDALKKAATA